MVIIEAATQVAVTVSRVVSLAAVGRATRDRAARMREEMSQRQLKEVLESRRRRSRCCSARSATTANEQASVQRAHELADGRREVLASR